MPSPRPDANSLAAVSTWQSHVTLAHRQWKVRSGDARPLANLLRMNQPLQHLDAQDEALERFMTSVAEAAPQRTPRQIGGARGAREQRLARVRQLKADADNMEHAAQDILKDIDKNVEGQGQFSR